LKNNKAIVACCFRSIHDFKAQYRPRISSSGRYCYSWSVR